MNYIQVTIFTSPAEQEILIAKLSELGAIGFEESDQFLLCYFSENDYSELSVNQAIGRMKFTSSVLEDRNWNAVWEENFEPVIVGDFCGIRAHFHKPIGHVRHEIIITPKMSFGTGHHATTYMMIQQMKDLEFGNREVFDFGTGTGILTILAKKLGASHIVAIDVDEWSIENARENFERNDVDNIDLYESGVLPDSDFDIILANINRNVLLQYAMELRAKVRKNGYLLLSGILAGDEAEICSSFFGCAGKLVRRQQSGNWLSILFQY